jgi:hypothetical protein
MPETNLPARIRAIFLHSRPHVDLAEATTLLGWSRRRMRDAIHAGEIEVVTTELSQWLWREELIAKALEAWPRETIESALGTAVETVLPFHIQLTDLHARVPRYQVTLLEYLATQQHTSVSEVLTRELDGVASAYAEQLTTALPGFAAALAWPDGEPAPC